MGAHSNEDRSTAGDATSMSGNARRPSPGGPAAWLSRTLAGVCLLALAGCQNMVAESGVYYNDGLASAFNRLLLANIVRSAKGQPTYYSAIGDYSASSSSTSPSLSADFPLNALDEGELSVNLGPKNSRDRNANVSSLESKDFAQSMHTPITTGLLVFLFEGRDGLYLNLVTALAMKRLSLSAGDYQQLAVAAIETCNTQFSSLPSTRRGICGDFSEVLAAAACRGDEFQPANAIITLYNDPTNPCEYARFRLFAESMAVVRPRMSTDKDGNTVLTVGIGGTSQRLFGTKGSGFTLRSPNEVIQYLGEIVRVRFEDGPAATPRLSSRNAESVPIFAVKSGSGAKRAADHVKIDGTYYALPDQGLGEGQNDYSYRSLAIVKDLLTLNTSQAQLPRSPTIILGGSNN